MSGKSGRSFERLKESSSSQSPVESAPLRRTLYHTADNNENLKLEGETEQGMDRQPGDMGGPSRPELSDEIKARVRETTKKVAGTVYLKIDSRTGSPLGHMEPLVMEDVNTVMEYFQDKVSYREANANERGEAVRQWNGQLQDAIHNEYLERVKALQKRLMLIQLKYSQSE